VVSNLLKAALCACFLILAPALLPSAASAQDVELAKSEYQLGWQALQKKDYKRALVHYQRSYAEVPRPRTMYNIAVCEEETGKYQAAIDHYQEFLNEAEARDADFLALARDKLVALKKRIGAVLKVNSEPAGATVRVDGQIKGHTPLRLDLVAGTHLIRVSHKATRSSDRRIVIRAGEDITENFSLDPVGTVSLKVSPSDALIRRKDVDDVATGHYQAKLSPGRYEFEVSLMGYRTRTIVIDVEPSAGIQKTVRLKARSSTGLVSVRSDINGANVTIDGIIVGSMRRRDGVTATIERRLTAGNHTMIVEPRGVKPWSKRFHLSPGETLAVDLKFRSEGKRRKVLRWGLTAIGAAAVATGLTLGAMALKDVRSDEDNQHDRGKDRASNADVLLGIGAVSLTGAWYLKGNEAKAQIERTHEEEAPPDKGEGKDKDKDEEQQASL
jgi:hypothetical protein